MRGNDIYLLVAVGMLFLGMVAVAPVLFYIRYRRRLERERLSLHEAGLRHQKELLYSVIRSQEEERARIGRDLHDEVGTALSRLRMTIGRFTRASGNDPALTDLARGSNTSVDTIINSVRHILQNLSPDSLRLYGFTGAVEDLADSIAGTGLLRVCVHNEAADACARLGHETALALYRVLQELLANTVKHADAQEAALFFRMDNSTLVIEYTDDGRGITGTGHPKKGGMGLQNIESRLGMIGAAYSIRTAAGQGFTIRITAPLPADGGQ